MIVRSGQYFDCASRHFSVDVLLITRAHRTGHLDAEFITQFEASFNASARSGSKNTLNDASRSRMSMKMRLPKDHDDD
jgi:hypothetical protein